MELGDVGKCSGSEGGMTMVMYSLKYSQEGIKLEKILHRNAMQKASGDRVFVKGNEKNL